MGFGAATIGVRRRRLAACAFCLVVLSPAAAAPAAAEGLSCEVRKFDPVLDWEFRFFTRFLVTIPIEELAGGEGLIEIAALVSPVSVESAEPVLIRQRLRNPGIPEGFKGDIEIGDSFVVGEGRYHIEWRLEDDRGRACSLEWDVEAKLGRKERDVSVTMAPGEIGDSLVYLFRPERSVADPGLGRPLRLKVFLNFDVRRRRRQARVRLWEFMPRISILRSLSRHPRVGAVSLVVYSVEEQEVFLSHEPRDSFDFFGMQDALEKLTPATVSFGQLGKDKEKDFFGELMAREIPSAERVDAYVFVGPDPAVGQKLSKQARGNLARVPEPVFFLNTSRRPWRGLVGNTVRQLGGKEYKIHDPRQLSESIAKLLERLEAER